jgi:nitrite reductase/ring-hydroxylating ferredoxin subunit
VSTETDGTEFQRLASLSDLRDGRPIGCTLDDGRAVCLVRVANDVFALEDQCSHADFPMSDGDMVDDHAIECPLHGARFDVRDGAVLEAPADEPLRTFEVRVEDGDVWVKSSP